MASSVEAYRIAAAETISKDAELDPVMSAKLSGACYG